MSAVEAALRRELEEAFAGRAQIYRRMFEEFEREIGAERAEAVMMRALEQRGRDVAAALFAGVAPEPRAVGEKFLGASPDGGRMYPHEAAHEDGTMHIRVARCPLKDSWAQAGLAPQQVARLCRIAGAFDKGLFEAAGLAFSNETWSAARGGGCCWISLSKVRA